MYRVLWYHRLTKIPRLSPSMLQMEKSTNYGVSVKKNTFGISIISETLKWLQPSPPLHPTPLPLSAYQVLKKIEQPFQKLIAPIFEHLIMSSYKKKQVNILHCSIINTSLHRVAFILVLFFRYWISFITRNSWIKAFSEQNK